MFDHRGWGRNLEAKTMDWRGVGSLVGRRKGFFKTSIEALEILHTELMLWAAGRALTAATN